MNEYDRQARRQSADRASGHERSARAAYEQERAELIELANRTNAYLQELLRHPRSDWEEVTYQVTSEPRLFRRTTVRKEVGAGWRVGERTGSSFGMSVSSSVYLMSDGRLQLTESARMSTDEILKLALDWVDQEEQYRQGRLKHRPNERQNWPVDLRLLARSVRNLFEQGSPD